MDLKALSARTDSFSGSDLKRTSAKSWVTMQNYGSPNFVDLCVSAALDAVKEAVELPWKVPSTSEGQAETFGTSEGSTRTLKMRHF